MVTQAEKYRSWYARQRGKVCRHCSRWKVTRPRGLCEGCYQTGAVRALYPPGSVNPAMAHCARRSPVADSAGRRPLPSAPTTAAPGTPEKVAVMEARALAGTQVFHPWDAAAEGDPAPLLFWAA